MRVVFLGTPEFALPSLEALHASSHRVTGVITQPDRPAGRGQRLTPSPVKELGLRLGIPVFQPGRLGQDPGTRGFLGETKPDLMVVVAFGQLLRPEVFGYPSLGTINVHASLLPRHRGAAPVVHTLIEGERETGVTIMKIDAGLDTGPILSQSVVPIEDEATAGEVEKLLACEGADLLLRTIVPYAAGELEPRAQDDALASHAPRLLKQEAAIDWRWKAKRVHDWVRALNPRPSAFTHLRGERVRIWSTSTRLDPLYAPGGRGPGQIVRCSRDELVVECGGGTLVSILELQWPGRRRMRAGDFINGLHVQTGEVFA